MMKIYLVWNDDGLYAEDSSTYLMGGFFHKEKANDLADSITKEYREYDEKHPDNENPCAHGYVEVIEMRDEPNFKRTAIMSVVEFLEKEIEKSRSFLALQCEHYPEHSFSVERAKARLAEQERLYRVACGF